MRIIYILILFSAFQTKSSILGRIYFETGGVHPSKNSYETLQKIAERVLQDSSLLIDCIGYTDTTGSPKKNHNLSIKRALAIKNIFVKKYNIPPERIFAIGGGEVATPNPGLARRVDIKIHTPDAILTDYKNKVFLQPSYTLTSWLFPRKQEPLYKYYKVKTGKLSIAEIYFPGKGSIELQDEALLIIYGKTSKKHSSREKGVALLTGKLLTFLDKIDKTRDKKIDVHTPAASINLYSKRSNIGVSKEKTTLVSIFDGYAEVMAKGKKVRVKEGEGTYIKLGKPPAPPVKLPPQPDFKHMKTVFNNDSVYFTIGTEKTNKLHIQIAKDSLMRNIIIDTVLNTNIFSQHLSPGDYFIRASTLNPNGIEGEFSRALKFSVANTRDTTPPPLYVLKVKQISVGKYRITLKSEVGATLFADNNIIELNDTILSFTITTKNPILPIKCVDEAGNTVEDTIKLPERRKCFCISVTLATNKGLHLNYLNNSSFLSPGIGLETRVYANLYLGIHAFYSLNSSVQNSNPGGITGHVKYSFPLLSILHPGFSLEYGFMTYKGTNTHTINSFLDGFGGELSIEITKHLSLTPEVQYYILDNGNQKKLKSLAIRLDYKL